MPDVAPINLPENIRDAINLLWKHSEDATWSTWSKEEIEKEGYDSEFDNNYYIRFVIGKK